MKVECCQLPTLLILIFLNILAPNLVSGAEIADLSDLVGGLERECQLSKPLQDFRAELNQRYTFEKGSTRLRKRVNIPARFVSAIGRAHAIDHGDHTEIIIPLTGTYRGSLTRSISFRIGHSNGIAVTTLAFREARREVEKTLSSDVIKSQKKFETDPDVQFFGFTIGIVDRSRIAALVCNTST